MILTFLCALVWGVYFFEDNFDTDPQGKDGWIQSEIKDDYGKWDWSAGKFPTNPENKGYQTTQDAHFYAITKKFEKVVDNKDKNLVIQFSVKHEQKIDCGGGYLKIFGSQGKNFEKSLDGDSQYQIMFGPDICDSGIHKVHAIFHFKDKNLLSKKSPSCPTDEFTHVYTLVVRTSNKYEILIDGEEAASGSMYDDWDFYPEREIIKDPEVKKPEGWVDETEIDDPNDTKPAGYDDVPAEIPDSEVECPDDWDEEEDGEWEAPMIDNPEFKGDWQPKKIPNPDYKGKWEHPMISNPEYVDPNSDPPIYLQGELYFIALEIWQVKSGTIFDNMLVTDDEDYAKKRRDNIIATTAAGEKAAEEAKKAEEEAKKAAEADQKDDEDENDEDENDEVEDDFFNVELRDLNELHDKEEF